MQRRSLLKLGAAAAALVAVAGGGLALLQPGLAQGRLTAPGRDVFRAVARGVLDGSLPADAAHRDASLTALLQRLDGTLANLPAATQAEVSQLLALLASAPGRIALVGMHTPWAKADVAEIQKALEGLRGSSLVLHQQVYFGLHDLTAAAFYADPQTWVALGYPGPHPI